MNFGRITSANCANTPPPVDARCDDPAFALLNPGICGISSQLIIKPESALSCLLGSIQFKAYVVSNGRERDVTSSAVFTTSNSNVAVVGASSGNATALDDGVTTITATYGIMTANASLSVLGGVNCCDQVKVGFMVLVDISKSMTQAFSGAYPQRIDFAKAAARRFISQVNATKDVVGLSMFDDSAYTPLAAITSNVNSVVTAVDSIASAAQLTGYKVAVNAAIASLDAAGLDQKVLVIISDGEDTSNIATDATDTLNALSVFKSSGGVVICLGVRAAGTPFSLLEAFSSGGFFLNSYNAVAAEAIEIFNGMKGYLCAGNCTPAGDTYVATGQLDYCAFKNWNVYGGNVDLIGNGLLDFLPNNSLYVDLAGSSSPHNGQFESKNSFALQSGHNYRLSLNLAGNQRYNGSPNTVNMRIFGRNNDGLTNPSIAPALTVNESGAPLGDTPTYKYVYTYTNAYGETIGSPVSSATPTGDTATISVQTTANPSATAINIYRTTGQSPDSPYYLIATIANTAPVYVDHMNMADMQAAILLNTISACAIVPTQNTTGSQVDYLNQSFTINNYQQGFTPQSFSFVAPDNVNVWIRFQQTATPAAAPAAGLLLDSVSFDDATNIETLLFDDFSTENETYIPPACGIGSAYVPIGTGVVALIPPMTSDTTPSGVASASSHVPSHDGDPNLSMEPWKAFCGIPNAGPFDPHQSYWESAVMPAWLQYKFETPQLVTAYEFVGVDYDASPTSCSLGPKTWTFQGSNDGVNFVTLDTQTNYPWPDATCIQPPTRFQINNTQAFSYYRLNVSLATSGFNVFISGFQMFGGSPATYGYAAGYNCYGSGCLDTPPGVQLPDPSPLPSIEAGGYTPPTNYSSSQTACATCPSGGTQVTADNDAVGPNVKVEVSDGTYFDFTTPPILNIICFTFTMIATPNQFALSLYGSNDAVNWTKIYFTSNRGFAADVNGDITRPSQIQIASCGTFDPINYKYFKLVYDKSTTTLTAYSFGGLAFAATPELCKSATATSLISQADADTKAYNSALAAAQAAIQCINAYTATESYTANCPIGKTGQSVTKTANYTSLVSLLDAQTQALAAAKAAADAAISCTCVDISANGITINDIGKATPYPSVACVSGLTGLITKVTLAINGYQHQRPNDVSIILMAPDGTLVNVLRNVGGNVPVTGINLVLDDASGSSISGSTMVSGTFKPSQLGVFSAFPLPCPSGTPNLTLAAFIGKNPNGVWLLWVQDVSSSDTGAIGSWSLNISSS